MRTRDAATSVLHRAVLRDARPLRAVAFDAKAVRDAALRALRRSRDADVHPGEHFVRAGVDFFHGAHATNCDHCELSYDGPKMSFNDAGEVLSGLGYEEAGRNGDGVSYTSSKGTISLTGKAPGTKDRRARDDDPSTATPMDGTGSSDPSDSDGGSGEDPGDSAIGGMTGSDATPSTGTSGTETPFSGGSDATPTST